MSSSCPVSAHVCQEAAKERDELAQWKNRATPVLDALALWKAEALPVLDGLQELGKALGLPLGSRITGTEALAAVERLTRERDEARAEVERLRAGIKALHRPVEIEPSETVCARCSWQLPNGRFFGQVVEWPCPTAALLNPTEGETDDAT